MNRHSASDRSPRAASGRKLSGRLPSGGLIDRGRPLQFRFDGQVGTAFPGDTLASALLANGIRLVGRSFKYHRPRGILTAGSEEPNALVELREGARREPNTRATIVEMFDGLVARSQNRFPSLAFDLMAASALAAPLLSAGFYYKTFMFPVAFWEKLYEPLIRRAAGLGRAAADADPDRYDKVSLFCDILVVGAGPAGLAAALTAARSGARVILCDEDFRPGGRLLSDRVELDDHPAMTWVDQALREFESCDKATLLLRTCVNSAYDGGVYAALQRVADHLPVPGTNQPRQRLVRITATCCVLASGAVERPVILEGNDRPGVMLAGAVRSYLNRFAVAPGREAVVFGNTDSALATADDLARAGIRVHAIIDSRHEESLQIRALGERLGIPYSAGARVTRTHGTTSLTGVTIADRAGETRRIRCDLLALSGGWSPALGLATHQNGRPVWDETLCAFIPGDLPPGMFVAGSVTGLSGTGAALASGHAVGAAAVATCGLTPATLDMPVTQDLPDRPGALWHTLEDLEAPSGAAFVDFQNDVMAKDIRGATREGYVSVEHLKRYTTLGMATDQGKTSNVNGLALLAAMTGRSIAETGTTTTRPPVQPIAIGALAGPHRGRHFRPERLTPTHDWARAHGAHFTTAGLWMRAQWFARPSDPTWQETVNREVMTVRRAVGFCDVTTLGKIDIQGPDATRFLERIYCNNFARLAVGRVRYGLMLREDGFAFDDGTTARLGETHYLMTTTTANAAKIMEHLEYCRQWLFPEDDVQMISVTDEWAQIALAGPKSREVLAAIVDPGFDVGNAALPFMATVETTVCGSIPARLFRISFSGELAYEIAVPARHGAVLADALMRAGAPFSIAPYGTEALGVLRIEKGHPAGSELNGQTTAHDLGFGKLLSRKKDYIGARMAQRPALTDPGRQTLVGLMPLAPDAVLGAGAHLLPDHAAATAANDQGWVSSSAWSPTCGSWIGLGFLADGAHRHREIVAVHDPVRGNIVRARVCPPVFVDPDGGRLHA
ncbi:sarcosine oxidase subunit alpha family protein [Gluconacetobacter azotocaptans]|uniref:Sarcosine oxidase subunit alpha family protein n=1 Tax=Gluconacetobacter azotocaptans TaxID=142834 RepID=A0A7W4JTV7_9PROT|nr:sarcosine oxidase subunit alpha family protein [Gluconacetobacter azotocaptans]MBB2190818.1 sarcosine oxidase subunit alpha family protein [Gluconacetobacter azotocaptans]GBQ30871.1 putative NAD/FAD-dependent oxidoreductase [Gluconacetobacter azotocaptans DSM 13594]